METVKYSIVIPLFNEEESLPALVGRLKEVMGELDGPAEVVMVDDGSRDSTYQLMTEANREDPRFKVIQLSRNFGHQLAITAGMDATAGQAVIVMDADLQDPPHVILEMAAKWQEGYEVVYAVRERREGERLFKTATASIFYSMLHRMADVELSFRLRARGGRAVAVSDLPLVRHEHRLWESTDPAERERMSKRNMYRFLDRWREREDLLVGQ